MYAGGRGNAAARRLSALWSRVLASGLAPRRWVRLDVVGRRSGQVRSFPLGLADVGGQWFAVSMPGECAWVRNVRAAHGEVVLRGAGMGSGATGRGSSQRPGPGAAPVCAEGSRRPTPHSRAGGRPTRRLRGRRSEPARLPNRAAVTAQRGSVNCWRQRQVGRQAAMWGIWPMYVETLESAFGS
ncbi:nitroreductase/quinone reductase family protein [Nostocoides sp. F2B08]|uniref:nitroreductase/quinone reductase family protein n=1 Tax=Nostocoides sp. F2B08 TaxID=2653936 RepID=UPI001D039C7F|nr:nitroreductase/quinone reductase family protein [Tetrasphaera sp. F2B08]